jgi:hypothetical protein
MVDYAGHELCSREEDSYNPANFVELLENEHEHSRTGRGRHAAQIAPPR